MLGVFEGLAAMVVVEEISSHDHGSRALTEGDLASTLRDLQSCARDVLQLQKKQDALSRKVEEADLARGAEIQAILQRVDCIEHVMHIMENDKRSTFEQVEIAFKQQFHEAGQDRQNLAASIVQINENFERVCSDMSEMQQGVSDMQRRMDKLSQKLQTGFADADRCFAECSENLSELRAAYASLISADAPVIDSMRPNGHGPPPGVAAPYSRQAPASLRIQSHLVPDDLDVLETMRATLSQQSQTSSAAPELRRGSHRGSSSSRPGSVEELYGDGLLVGDADHDSAAWTAWSAAKRPSAGDFRDAVSASAAAAAAMGASASRHEGASPAQSIRTSCGAAGLTPEEASRYSPAAAVPPPRPPPSYASVADAVHRGSYR